MRLDHDRVRLDGEQGRRAGEPRLLEKAPAPADARHVGVSPDETATATQFAANGRSSERGDVREHLVPALGSRPDDRRGTEPLGELDDRLRDRARRVRGEDLRLRDVQRPDTVLRERR